MPLQFVKLPSRLGDPKWGDAGLCFTLDWVSSLGTDWVEGTAELGDEGKAVGCVPPTALLSEQTSANVKLQNR